MAETRQGSNAEMQRDLTVDDLKRIVRETVPVKDSPPKRSSKQNSINIFVNKDFSLYLPVHSYDEVFPGIYLGDKTLARNKENLQKLGITHILNAAQGEKFAQIDTNEAYYADLGLQFMGINAQDVSKFRLEPYFMPAADFIDGALKSGGRVAVHCHQGISRSATLVLAYLMTHHGMTAPLAIQTVREKRAIFPNEGFLKQIAQLHNTLYAGNHQSPEYIQSHSSPLPQEPPQLQGLPKSQGSSQSQGSPQFQEQ